MKKKVCLLLLFPLLCAVFSSCDSGKAGDGTTEESISGAASTETSSAEADVTDETTSGMTSEKETDTTEADPPKDYEKKSVIGFLKIASAPVGETMYVWGGGWNEEDTGAGIEAVTLGVSPRWSEFATLQDEKYDYKSTKYQIHDGLDCSGYIGWAVYNVLESENGHEGYVLSSTSMASAYADIGLGKFTDKKDVKDWRAGDIMSMKGHAWISLGQCEDGSVLLLHSSPPGVAFCGTELPDGGESEAVRLAEQIMREHYPDWYGKYPNCSRPYSYLTESSSMRWNENVLSDNEKVRNMSAYEIAKLIFE